MIYSRFSPRQRLAMTWWNRQNSTNYDGIICDGAVRSGKTLAMSLGFFLWSMCSFENQVFGICGKTIGALRRNIVGFLPQWLGGLFRITDSRSENKLTVTCGGRRNTYYLFGGQDESACQLIQGITLAGVLLDEAVLMPRSFVEQACARCSVSGSKLWFNCNPEGPEHWFYKEWIQKAQQKGLLHLHFTMEDNPGLSEQVKRRYHSLYTGLFYRRFVLGQWCVAEGLIYEFDPRRHLSTKFDNIVENFRNSTRNDKTAEFPTDSTGFDKREAFFGNSTRIDNIAGFSRNSTRIDNTTGSSGNSTRFDDMTGFSGNSTRIDKSGEFIGRSTGFDSGDFYISVDYGTRNPFSAGLWYVGQGKAWRIDEFYHDGRATGNMLTDEQYCDALEALAGGLPIRYGQLTIDNGQ